MRITEAIAINIRFKNVCRCLGIKLVACFMMRMRSGYGICQLYIWKEEIVQLVCRFWQCKTVEVNDVSGKLHSRVTLALVRECGGRGEASLGCHPCPKAKQG